MSIHDVHHQPRALRLIERAMHSARMPHAYIFHGPEGVGREMLAMRLARVILCGKGGAEACGACESCVLAGEGTHPDLHVIHRELIKLHPDPEIRARKGLVLGIDVIRTFVIERAATKPHLGRAKVFILREAERMNPEAQNALLKTLEEPPAGTFLMLIAATLDRLLETVRSRCQPVPFGLLPPDFVTHRLRAAHPDLSDEEAQFCALHADGSLGVALRHHEDRLIDYDGRLTQAVAALDRRGVTDTAEDIIADAKKLGERYQGRDADISDTEAQRRGLKALFSLLSTGFRGGLRATLGVGGRDDPYALADRGLSPVGLAEAIRTIVKAERQIDQNANTQLCVEGLLIRLRRILQADNLVRASAGDRGPRADGLPIRRSVGNPRRPKA